MGPTQGSVIFLMLPMLGLSIPSPPTVTASVQVPSGLEEVSHPSHWITQSSSTIPNDTPTPSSIRWEDTSNTPTARSWNDNRQPHSPQSATPTSTLTTDSDSVDPSTYTVFTKSDRPDDTGEITRTMSELVITEVYHYSPTILEHHLPTPGLMVEIVLRVHPFGQFVLDLYKELGDVQ